MIFNPFVVFKQHYYFYCEFGKCSSTFGGSISTLSLLRIQIYIFSFFFW
jgi:hypothetical protein